MLRLLVVGLVACGSKPSDGSWERSRDKYCETIHLVKGQFEHRLRLADQTVASLEKLRLENNEAFIAGQCDRLLEQLETAGEVIAGFDMGLQSLGAGTHKPREEVGLVESITFDVVAVRAEVLRPCFGAKLDVVSSAITKARTSTIQQIDRAADRCTRIARSVE